MRRRQKGSLPRPNSLLSSDVSPKLSFLDLGELMKSSYAVPGYQLIRGVLAAHATGGSLVYSGRRQRCGEL
jgi:hypothetical protein